MAKGKGPTPKREWQELKPAVAVNRAKSEAAFKMLAGIEPGPLDLPKEMWMNDRYTVSVTRREDGSVSSLSIRRNDRGWPRDWRDFQRIKNQLAGADAEAVELYPAESRLVDTANQFWLWCGPPGFAFPFGFDEGRSVTGPEVAESVGGRQRPIDAVDDRRAE